MNPTNQHFLGKAPGAIISLGVNADTVKPLPPPRAPEPFLRAYVATGAPAVDVGSGAVCSFDAVTRDIPASNLRYLIGGVTDGAFVFTYPGVYLCQHSTAIEVNLGGASSYETESNTAKVTIRAGGTDIETSAGYFGAEQKPNFAGFLKKDGEGPWAPTVDLTDLVTFTEIITPIPVVDGETLPSITTDPSTEAMSGVTVTYGGLTEFGQNGTFNVTPGVPATVFIPDVIGIDYTVPFTVTPAFDSDAVSNVTLNDVTAIDVLPETALEDDGRLKATADAETSSDFAIAVDGAAAITTGGGGITGSVKGTASGSALIFVEYNADGVLKIKLDGVEKDPILDVYGSRDGTGGRPMTCVNVSLSILRISGPRPVSAWETP